MKRAILLSFALITLTTNAQTNSNLSDDVVENAEIVETESEQSVMAEQNNTVISPIIENGTQQEKEKPNSTALAKDEQQIHELIIETITVR